MSIERVGEGRPAVGPSLRSGGGVRSGRVSLRVLARQPLAERHRALRGARAAVDAAETEVWDAASGDGLEGDANAV